MGFLFLVGIQACHRAQRGSHRWRRTPGTACGARGPHQSSLQGQQLTAERAKSAGHGHQQVMNGGTAANSMLPTGAAARPCGADHPGCVSAWSRGLERAALVISSPRPASRI